ncbi:MAG: multicomponent Na+:H+ antiporter subunit [Tenuifilum sp.]|jgi:multicomponent Na+:H+ antiporter subunit D|uniref:proton-conducting transporter transmembrane domain-containing protein n=1 Tax=Tenuifilum sp. TaxID=2760880 RepID=UPI0024AB265A|nr:proton-conducting transporter membrane subunit [Tenuifilum sp.]MDI3526765.1 multicomponent Na+:H+ antiporter subunit [Tenuifilum sp.]
MQNIALVTVLLTPLATAILMFSAWGRKKLQVSIGAISTLLQLIAAITLFQKVNATGIEIVNVGSWPTGFGIMLVADRMSAIYLLLSSFMSVVAFWYAVSFIKSKTSISIFFPVYFFLVFGLTGTFLAGDIFNLYVWFEVMLVSSFVLFTIGADKQQLEGSLKYVAINVLSSTLFLIGIGLLYGLTGHLNMAMIGKALPLVSDQLLVNTTAVFFFISFGIKAAIFPLFFWLPASYHTAPIGFTALIVALLTKVGIYSMTRFFTVIYPLEDTFLQIIMLVLAALTMVIGVLGAAAQVDFRKILSFHIVSQIGYMLMGLAIFTPLAIAGSLFFVIHNVLVKTNLFFVAGTVNRNFGSYKLKGLGGVLRQSPWLALFFAISAFALTGIPPLTGFWGKYLLAWSGFQEGSMLVVTVTTISLLVSLLTLFSMTKIWNEVFWKPSPNGSQNEKFDLIKLIKLQPGMMLSIIAITLVVLVISFSPNSVIEWSMKASNFLVDNQNYIESVLNHIN